MPSYFRLLTAHGHDVAIEAGRLVAARRPAPDGVIPLVAARLGDRVILTANVAEAIGFAPPGQSLASGLLALRGVGGPSRLALIHPATGRYLTGPPLQASTGRITAADALQNWEWFTPEGVADVWVHAEAVARLALMRDLLAGGLSAEALAAFIAAVRPGAAAVLDAALAMIDTSTLDALALRVVSDPALRAALSALYPIDPWAQTALPGLAAWRAWPPPAAETQHGKAALKLRRPWPGTSKWRKEPPSPQAGYQAEPAPPDRRRVIGAAFDVLGLAGTRGDFASLPHACSARARRLEPPGEGVAVVATARNEGIYLLEWIAHHRCLGARAIYVYSNDNQDGSDVLLGALADAGIITWISSRLGGGLVSPQFKAYGHALGCMPDLLGYEWVLLIDIDEFLMLDRARFAGLEAFGAWHRRRGADTVAINWQFMASEEGHDPCTVPLTRRNTRVLGKQHVGEGVRLVKSMSRPNRVAHSEAHVPFADERSHLAADHAGGGVHSWHNPPPGFAPFPKFSDRIITGPAVINHYFFKSAAEWMWKHTRNHGDHPLESAEGRAPMGEAKALTYLRQLRATGLTQDERARAGAADLDREIFLLLSHPKISAATAAVHEAYHARLAAIRALYAQSSTVMAWSASARPFLDLAGCTLQPCETGAERA